jgi:hypothetical protein
MERVLKPVEVAVVAHRQAVRHVDIQHDVVVHRVAVVVQALEVVERALMSNPLPRHRREVGDDEVLDGLQIVKRNVVARRVAQVVAAHDDLRFSGHGALVAPIQ